MIHLFTAYAGIHKLCTLHVITIPPFLSVSLASSLLSSPCIACGSAFYHAAPPFGSPASPACVPAPPSRLSAKHRVTVNHFPRRPDIANCECRSPHLKIATFPTITRPPQDWCRSPGWAQCRYSACYNILISMVETVLRTHLIVTYLQLCIWVEIMWQDVMRRLVSRYILQWKKNMRQDGVSEDDLLEIKQDISSLRYKWFGICI